MDAHTPGDAERRAGETVTTAGTGPSGAEATAALAPGAAIRQYELIRLLGRGGMGEVHLARDTRLGRKVAIKFLRPGSPEALQRFLAEARVTAQCTHESIVVVHEVGDHGDRLFMVLEHLEGQTLAALLREGPLPPLRAVELALPVVRALARAHAFGLVHRDLKPDNIFVLDGGGVKVLDFGVAKLCADASARDGGAAGERRAPMAAVPAPLVTQDGALVGTVPYMAPEQWNGGRVDPRTDLWQLGLILREMVTGENPLVAMGFAGVARFALDADATLPPVADAAPQVPAGLARVIETCLERRPEARFQSADALAEALTALLPTRYGAALGADESPYPGLVAFQERDAARFFGRSRETDAMATRIRELPMMAVVGPSGVGKSSFVRAGLVPRLKASGEAWEVLVTRPGRRPLAALADVVAVADSAVDARGDDARQAVLERLRAAPGDLGRALRERALRHDARVLLIVDQLEELYTLATDRDEQQAFIDALCGAADDASAPVRVVLSLRSDFLDRAAEDPRLIAEISRGLVFLRAPTGDALRDAIVQPAELAGYRFESQAMVDAMLAALEGAPGALPLLQFAASQLWQARDPRRRLLTRAAYDATGGVEGLLAKHADDVLAQLDAPAQRLCREMFRRLVTPERTRAIVDVAELEGLAEDAEAARRTLQFLVEARLVVVQTDARHEGATVELVHESLIARWPTLQRWLEEDAEHAGFLAQLRTAARQWEARGRPQGLLWRGEAHDEARLFRSRFRGDLAPLEEGYLEAVFALAQRTVRARRVLIAAIIVVLAALSAFALINMVDARDNATAAGRERDRAQAAERQVSEQLEELQAKERARLDAEAKARTARSEADQGRVRLASTETELVQSYAELEAALKAAKAAAKEAEAARREAEANEARAERASDANRKLATAERAARERAEQLLAEKNALVKRLEAQLERIETQRLR
ncbi:MAG: serine/threonine-protein kinase PknK [Deltaproteobacteria bacterium]|nr:MAG: serine/threonine-protein kinase PknK [Deltaproteobacteria bacterium]